MTTIVVISKSDKGIGKVVDKNILVKEQKIVHDT